MDKKEGKDYFICRIKAKKEKYDLIIAILSELLPFDSFEEKKDSLDAYLTVGIFPENIDADIKELAIQLDFSFSWDKLPDKNWNEEWESGFKPVYVDKFCQIRADFHNPQPGIKYDIVINPKMAFGTGHHETTFMMIKMMAGLSFSGKKILDYGCGTGILAILASKLNALEIDAVDIEKPAYENTIENAQINDVFNIRALLGDINAVLDEGFDIILANINRNVILNSFETIRKKMKPNSILLISGILKQDEEIIMKAIQKNGFTIDSRLEKGEWMCMKLLP